MEKIYDSKILVTGGAGFVGSHLCDQLIELNNHVFCLDNLVGTQNSTRNIAHLLENPLFTFINKSVTEWSSPKNLEGFEYIFHQAASKNTVSIDDPTKDLETNALGTLKLLLSAKEVGVKKFVHGSTGSVYGESKTSLKETTSKNPVSFYGVSKLAGESYCQVVNDIYGLDFTVLRYFHVIGTRQYEGEGGGVVPIFVKACIENEPLTIFGNGDQIRSFTSVHDVVTANILSASLGPDSLGVFNCASAIKVSIKELADFIMKEMDNSKEINYEEKRPGDILNFDINNDSIRELGMSFSQDWKSTVREVIDDMSLEI